MGSIRQYKLKSGEIRYEVQGYLQTKKGTGLQQNYHRRGLRTKEEARQYVKQTEAAILNQLNQSLQPNMRLGDWLENWINNYKVNVKEGAMIIYRYQVDHYLIPNIGQYQLKEYTPAVHQQFINKMLDSGGKDAGPLSENSVRIINATLNNAFTKAKALGLIDSNPTRSVEFPRNSRKQHKLHYWTRKQADTFLKASRKASSATWFPFFLTLIDTGMRKGEAMALQWRDIDFKHNTIAINKTRLYRAETGVHKHDIIVDDPKTPSANRTLFMTPRLAVALKDFYNLLFGDSQKILNFNGANSHADEIVFVNTTRSHTPTRGRSVNGAFTRITDDANLPKIKIHDLRHTHAVMLREAGVSLDDIRAILGHRSIETTQIYAEITPKVVQSATSKYIDYLNDAK